MRIEDLKRGDMFWDASGKWEAPHWRHICVKVDGATVWYMENNWNWWSMPASQLTDYEKTEPENDHEREDVADVLAGKADHRFPWHPTIPHEPLSPEAQAALTESFNQMFPPEAIAAELQRPSFLSQIAKDTKPWQGGTIQLPFKSKR